MLQDLQEWIEVKCPNQIFVRKSGQVFAFKAARNGTLEEIRKELRKREGRGELDNDSGYTGDWEVVGKEGMMDKGNPGGAEMEESDKSEETTPSQPTEAGLEEAWEAGRKAAEDADFQMSRSFQFRLYFRIWLSLIQ